MASLTISDVGELVVLVSAIAAFALGARIIASRSRLDESARAKVAGGYVCLCLVYMGWRVLALAMHDGTAGEIGGAAALLLCEAILVNQSIRQLRLLVGRTDRRSEADAGMAWWDAENCPAPRVSILIPTLNEPDVVLERTLVGALRQTHSPADVYLLDDGRREPIAALTERLGAHYLTRTGNDGAKAGNLNAALTRADVRAEFVAVLDADFIAAPQFVARALALMRQRDVALVQTPQLFLNRDPLQAAFPAATHLVDEQRMGFEDILPARDAAGVAHCCGTSFVVRMAALDSVGGVSTESALEDIMTSIWLRLRGWRISYLNEPLSWGLAPEGLDEFLSQRVRWARGSIQIARQVFARRSIGLLARLRSAEAAIRWLYVAPVYYVVLMAPVLYWGFDLRLLPGSAVYITILPLGVFIYYRVALNWITESRRLPLAADACIMLALAAMLKWGEARWAKRHATALFVTPKGVTRATGQIHLWFVLGMAGSASTLAGCMLVGWCNALGAGAVSALTVPMTLWTAYAIGVLSVTALIGIESPHRRLAERYRVGDGERVLLNTRAGSVEAVVVELSELAVVAMVAGQKLELEAGDSLELTLDGVGMLAARVKRTVSPEAFALTFEPTADERRRLIEKVYSARYMRPVRTGRFLDVLRGMAGRLLALPLERSREGESGRANHEMLRTQGERSVQRMPPHSVDVGPAAAEPRRPADG